MFQSAPGVRAGRKAALVADDLRELLFQSAPGVRAGRKDRQPRRVLPSREFQSAPGVRAGRKRPKAARPSSFAAKFQSAPGVRAGRKQPRRRRTRCGPAVSIRSRRSGREKGDRGDGRARHRDVSIRSRRSGREKADSATDCVRGPAVSIRSRRSGREKGRMSRMKRRTSCCFNPLPAFGPGERRPRRSWWCPTNCFNPLPAFGPGESPRVLRDGQQNRSFNPLPAFGPGERTRAGRESRPSRRFQSAPGVRAGRKDAAGPAKVFPTGFQSAPGVRAGRKSSRTMSRADYEFQSAPGVRAGRKLEHAHARTPMPFQSAPGVRAGRKGLVSNLCARHVALGSRERDRGGLLGPLSWRGGARKSLVIHLLHVSRAPRPSAGARRSRGFILPDGRSAFQRAAAATAPGLGWRPLSRPDSSAGPIPSRPRRQDSGGRHRPGGLRSSRVRRSMAPRSRSAPLPQCARSGPARSHRGGRT